MNQTTNQKQPHKSGCLIRCPSSRVGGGVRFASLRHNAEKTTNHELVHFSRVHWCFVACESFFCFVLISICKEWMPEEPDFLPSLFIASPPSSLFPLMDKFQILTGRFNFFCHTKTCLFTSKVCVGNMLPLGCIQPLFLP